jgi:putative DNA primase/helicase
MIKNDGELHLAIGMSAKSKIWKNKKIQWSELVTRLKETNRTTETLKEFISATKEEQLKIKDVGGYVGGYLRNGRRKPENVVNRQLLTLDIDFAHKDFWEDYCLQFSNAAVLHATHKHCETSPRFRLIMPLSRECTPDEYVATGRQIAGLMGIELFDKTTFETNRLMFWPSSPRDVEYYFQFQDGPWIDVDEILDSYTDWKDSSLWPTAEREINDVRDSAKKQEDPENKKGIVGAFCRTYSITEAISRFLEDIYIPTDIDGRYTYSKGTTAAGLIVYDDKFAYSHHGTDPCGGKLCNAFDLVRIHKFGHLDSDESYQGQKPKSFAAMEELAREDKAVKKIIAAENIQEAKYDFTEDLEENQAVEDEDIEWMQELEVDSKGNYLSTSPNLNLIFSNDHRLKKLFRQNDFDSKRYVFGNLPWRKVTKPEPVKNVDYSGVRNYIESIYGISGAMKVEDSMALEFEKNHYHPILDYLRALEWDKVQRLDRILIDYFGAEDCIYSKEAIRKMMVGAVARVFDPGVKFDLVLTLVSQEQGTGKSSFLKALGQSWFSDTFITVQGKEAFEQLQGAWLIEMAELSGLRKADIEAIKHFISKQEDMFRPAYARTPETYPRQCVFIATTNESTFLRDPSGNRRFMPVDIHNIKLVDNEKLKSFLGDKSLIDQIWAEAVYFYRKGENLYLSKEAEKIATTQQKLHSETDERRGLIEAYLNRLLPEDWDTMDLYERRAFMEDPLSEKGKIDRVYVCVAEIWCECLGKNKEDMDRYKTRDINDIMRGLDEWEQINSTRNFKIYGKQKYYARKLD